MIIRQLLLIMIATLLIGCGAQATQPPPTATEEPEVEETEVVEAEAESTEEPSEGEQLFTQFYEDAGFACSTCHIPNQDNRLLGPGLLNIEDRYETYDVDAEDLEAYIIQSIVDPRVFIVPDESPFPENIMPENYSDIFSDDELDEIVEYILSF